MLLDIKCFEEEFWQCRMARLWPISSFLIKKSQNASVVFLHPLITARRMHVRHHCVQMNCMSCFKKAVLAHLDCPQKPYKKPIFFLRVSTGSYGFSTGFLRVKKIGVFLENYVLRVSTGFLRVPYGFSTGSRFRPRKPSKKIIWANKDW